MMKYLMVLVLCMTFVVPCFADVKDDIKLGLNSISAGEFYDFQSEKFLTVAYTSVLTYKDIAHLDIGYVTKTDKIDQLNGIMAGISCDIAKASINKDLSANVGIGTGLKARDTKESIPHKFIYGFYGAIKYIF